jgi:hypothetical protein
MDNRNIDSTNLLVGVPVIRAAFIVFIVAASLFAGCQNSASNSGTNASAPTANAVNTNANSAPAATNATADDPGNFNGSPTEVYKAAYTARKKCDIAGLKKVMAKELLDFLGKMAKEDKKSLDDELKELCQRPQAATEQVRNEKIDGDHASIEYLDENNEWQPMDFVREGGVWKMGMSAHGQDEPDSGINDKDDNRS